MEPEVADDAQTQAASEAEPGTATDNEAVIVAQDSQTTDVTVTETASRSSGN